MKRRNDRKLKYKEELSCIFFMDQESREVIIFILVYFY